jgi:hypothetical protein
VPNGGDKPTGVLVAEQRAGRGNKGMAETERWRSIAGREAEVAKLKVDDDPTNRRGCSKCPMNNTD